MLLDQGGHVGQNRRFHCEGCHLTAAVSGGPDRGMMVYTETKYCPHCQMLSDIAIGSAPDVSLSDDSPEELQQEAEGGRYNVCPSCGSLKLTVWKNGDPCPRCGGLIVDDGPGRMWD